MEVDSVGIIAILRMSYRHSKNIDKCVKNPQSASRKPNYHTKCDKNCHKILSMCNGKRYAYLLQTTKKLLRFTNQQKLSINPVTCAIEFRSRIVLHHPQKHE